MSTPQEWHGNLLQDGKFNREGIIEIILLLQAEFKKLYTRDYLGNWICILIDNIWRIKEKLLFPSILF